MIQQNCRVYGELVFRPENNNLDVLALDGGLPYPCGPQIFMQPVVPARIRDVTHPGQDGTQP